MKKYLIHTGPGIGDMMHAFSMARAIKEQEKDARVDFLMRGTKNYFSIDSVLLQCQDYADHLYWYAMNEIWHDIVLLLSLILNRYDYGFVFLSNVTGYKSFWIYRIMRIAGCKKIVGSGSEKLDINLDIPFQMHYLKRNAAVLEAVEIKPRHNAISLNKEKLDNRYVETLSLPTDKKIIALSVGTNPMKWVENGRCIMYDVKSWAFERWAKLAQRLSDKNLFVIFIGGPKEKKEMEEKGIILPESPNILNLVGVTNLKQSLATISRCDLIVGAEGGMMHSASALGIPTLTIIGGSDHKRWNPGGENSPIVKIDCKCAPCYSTREAAFCKKHTCLTEISVDMVYNKVRDILNITKE